MRIGDRGDDVQILQAICNLRAPSVELVVDGDFGPKTEAALWRIFGVKEADKYWFQSAVIDLAESESTWRQRAITQAMNDWCLNIDEKKPFGRDFIANNIILPGWGRKAAEAFIDDANTFQYCGLTLERWWCSAGLPQKAQNLASPGRVIVQFAKIDKMGTVKEKKPRNLIAGDAVLHRKTPNSWKGHVMMGVKAATMRTPKFPEGRYLALLIEGNSSKSWGQSSDGLRLTKRQGIGLRLVDLEDNYINCFVEPNDDLFQ